MPENKPNSAATDASIEPRAYDAQHASAGTREPFNPKSSPIDLSDGEARPCKRCGTTTPPDDNGKCPTPTCRALRAGHQVTRKYALDEQDVRVKAARYVRDYEATTEDLRDACRELAEIVCTIKKMRKGTAEHQRLLAARKSLREELEAARASRLASSSTTNRQVVFMLPAKDDMEVRQAIERQRHAQPDAAEPSRDVAVGSAASAAADDVLDRYLVPERHRTSTESRVVMRAIRESEVEECMDMQGDLPRYRSGEIPRFVAYKQTQAWLKSKGGFQ